MKGQLNETIYGCFEANAERFHSKTAIVYLGSVLSYSQLRELIELLAISLQDLGVKKNDMAIIYLSNIPQWFIAWLGLMRLGAIPIPISPIYTPMDLKYMVNDSGAETIICMDTNFGYVENILPETSVKRVIVTTMVELLPLWKRLLGKVFNRVPEGMFILKENVFSFKKMLVKHSSSSLPSYESLGIRGDDELEMLYTGGTMGHPKGVPYVNQNFLTNCVVQRSMSEPVIPKGQDIVIQGAPLFHALGQTLGVGALLSGDTCILLPTVNLDAILYYIQSYKGTTFFGVPAIYRMILEHRRLDYYDLSSLKYCFSGGDVMPLEIRKRWLNKFGISICEGYGATETCVGVSLTPADEVPPEGSTGKLVPTKYVKVVNSDTFEPVGEGVQGELLVSSEHMVRGYWNKPEETAQCFIELNGRLWYKTRDEVRIDKDGWLYFMDRSGDMIKHKGYRIAASEIEVALQEHPAVIASVVVGVPDHKVGERIKAFVVLKEDIRGVTGYDLIRWCREKLAPYKVPNYIEFRDMLPKSKVGKLLRREIRSEEKRKRET